VVGFPPKLSIVRDMGLDLERKSLKNESEGFGKKKISGFLKRHPNWAIKFSTKLKRQNVYAEDPWLIQDYVVKL